MGGERLRYLSLTDCCLAIRYRGDTAYSAAVDVYSFGVIMFEIATRESPWQELEACDDTELFRELNKALQDGRRPTIPPEIVQSQPVYVELLRQSWAGDPADRPTFPELSQALADLVRAELRDS